MKTAASDPYGVYQSLMQRKKVILLTGFVGAGLAFAVARTLPLVYSSEGGLVIEHRDLSIPELSIGSSAPNSADDSFTTEADVLRSRGLVEKVVDKLDLAGSAGLAPAPRLPERVVEAVAGLKQWLGADPNADRAAAAAERRAAAVDYAQTHLRVDQKDRSRYLSLHFQAGSPAVAAAVVNTVMAEYLAADIAAKRAQVIQVNNWLSERAGDIRREAEAADQQVEKFLQDSNVQQVQGSSGAALQLSKDEAQLATARQEVSRLQAALSSANQMAAFNGMADAGQDILRSATMQALRQREALLLQQVAPLPPNSPSRVAFEEQLRNLRGQIAGETNKFVLAMRQNADLARSNVKALEATVETDRALARDAAVSEASLGTLKREAEAKRQLFNAFLTRAEQTRLAAAQLPSARILFEATPASRPDHSFGLLALLLGFFGGAFVAGAGTELRRALDRKVRSTEDMTSVTGLPAFGCLPEISGRARNVRTLTMLDGSPIVTETLRSVWLTIRAIAPQKSGTVVVVTSSEVGEGKTTVSAALARRMAGDGLRVLLIDADLRRPGLATALDIHPTQSLEAVLTGSARLDDALVRLSHSGLDCLLSEGNSANPMKMLASERFRALIDESRRVYDVVILDTPPVLRVADAVLMARFAQLTVFIVEAGRMEASLVEEALGRFGEEDRSRIVTLLTRVQKTRLSRGDYYGGYGIVRPEPAATSLPRWTRQGAVPDDHDIVPRLQPSNRS